MSTLIMPDKETEIMLERVAEELDIWDFEASLLVKTPSVP